MFSKDRRGGAFTKSRGLWEIRILTSMLCVAIVMFIVSYMRNAGDVNKSNLTYDLFVSMWILFIIIFLYFNYIKTSERIREKEREYSIIFNNVKDMILIRGLDSENQAVANLEANEAAIELLGYDLKTLSKMRPWEIVSPKERYKVDGITNEIIRNGEKTFETEFIAKDGRIIPVEINSRIFELNSQRVIMFVCRDLTERNRVQRLMRETERSYKNLFVSIPDGVLIQHFPGDVARIEFANESAAAIFGLDSPNELVGIDFLRLLNEKDAQNVKERRNLIVEGKEIPLVERTIETRRGIEKILEIKTISYNFEGDDKYISILRDITEKKAAEKMIVENDRQLRRLLEISPDGVFVYDWDKYLYVNESGARILGEASPKEVIDESIYSYIDPNHFGDMEERFRILEERKGEVPMIEQRLLRKDGSEVFVETKTILFPFAGKTSFVSIARDITEKLMLREEREKSEKRYRHLIENFPDAVFVYNREEYIFANPAAAELLELDNPSEIVGRQTMYFFKEERMSFLKERLAMIEMGARGLPLIEEEIITEEGTKLPVEVKTIRFPYSDSIAFLSVVRDIRERKYNENLRMQVESQNEYERMRTEYFANISHEFRTPLHAISGTLQLMELKNGKVMNEVPEFAVKNRRHIQIMKQNNNRLVKLVSNLIDINKIEAGIYRVNKLNCNITEIIGSIVASVTELARTEHIKMVYKTSGKSVIMGCDPEKIERIMLNLLSNAIKFTPKGGKITVVTNEKGDDFIVSVKDTGIGIEEMYLERIFDRFTQLEHVFTKQNEGSGIGLSLVKAFVKMHGGNVSATSEMGVGSCFTFSIPISMQTDEKGRQLPIEKFDDFEQMSKMEVEFSDVKKRYYEAF